MNLNFILSIVFLSCAYCSGQYLGEIGCQTDARRTKCEVKKKCTVTCPSSCGTEGATPNIWGTTIYSEDSSVCRSAIHDYRLSPASSKSNVTFVRSAVDPKKYLPSIQQGIRSYVSRSFSGHFFFSSPYFTEEEMLDVATLNYMSFYRANESFVQSCRISDQDTDTLQFQFYIPSNAARHLTGDMDVTWSKPQLQPGGYWCDIIDNTYSDVMSLAMPSDADFLPEVWTITSSTQESVVIKFRPRQSITSTPINATWRKDQEILYSFPNMRQSQNETGYYLEIEKVQSGDGGIYSLEVKNKPEKQGIFRLIVRRCKKDYFGPRCDQGCPDCQNGGVCHDILGNCICPPGFHGTNCENECPTGYFGQSCGHSCGSSRHSIDNTCQGALICLPDPYGCSCSSGYKGLDCMEKIGEPTPITSTTTATTSNTPTSPSTTSSTTTSPITSTTDAETSTMTTTTTPTTATETSTSTTTTAEGSTSTSTTTTAEDSTSTTATTPTTTEETSTSTTTTTPSTTEKTSTSTTTTTPTTTEETSTSTTTTTPSITEETSANTTTTTPTTSTTVKITSIPTTTIPTTTTTTTSPASRHTPPNGTLSSSTTTLSTSSIGTTLASTAAYSTTSTTPTTTARPTTTSSTTTTMTSTTTTSTISPEKRMCQSLTNNSIVTVVPSLHNSCQYGCIEYGRQQVIPILKADGEQCRNGICFRGACQETNERTVCPADFKGVRSTCKEYCYNVQYPGMALLMNFKDGELCIEEEEGHGICMNGKCIVKKWK